MASSQANLATSALKKLVRRIPEVLQTIGMLEDEAGSEDFGATRDSLGFTHPSNAVLPNVDEHFVPVYIGATKSHKKDCRTAETCSGRAIWLQAASLYQ